MRNSLAQGHRIDGRRVECLNAASNGATTAQFYYDGKNRQIARNINNQVIRFSAWDGWELLEEYSDHLNVTTGYLQGATGVIKSWSASNTLYYYQDKLGSTSHVASASGALLESYKYDLYGTPTYYVPSDPNPLSSSSFSVNDLFVGERWIPELGLYDLRNRFMSPEIGRFLQTDPIGFKGDASNLYRYCHNDPEDFTDPMGTNPPDVETFRNNLTSCGHGDWIKDSNGLSDWDFQHMSRQPPGMGPDNGGGGAPGGGGTKPLSPESEGKKARTAEQLAREMLRQEAGSGVDQTGGIVQKVNARGELIGHPYASAPVDGKPVYRNPNDPHQGILRYEERWTAHVGEKILYLVHFHQHTGKYGEPTEKHDLDMVKQYRASMYFSNKEMANRGQYMIIPNGRPPEIHDGL
jgi:RHS repeat-associated protein